MPSPLQPGIIGRRFHFRTKKNRTLEFKSPFHECTPHEGKKSVKIAVKVVDIFGNDTMTIVEVALGGK